MNPYLINIGLAGFWLVLGGYILIFELATGQEFAYRPAGVSVGWFCLALALFNTYRVWSIWGHDKRRREAQVENELLHRQFGRHDRPRVEQPPDPNFQFTDQPPAKPPEQP